MPQEEANVMGSRQKEQKDRLLLATLSGGQSTAVMEGHSN